MSLSLFFCCHVCKLPLLILSVMWAVLYPSIQFLCCSFMDLCVCVCARVCVHLCMCRQGRKHCVLLIKAPPSLMSPRKRYTIGTCRLATLHSVFGPQSCRQTDTRARTHARSLSAVTEVGRFTFLCPVIYTAEALQCAVPLRNIHIPKVWMCF